MDDSPPLRGAELVERVIAYLSAARGRFQVLQPRPLAPALIDRLTFTDGAPLPPSLRRWLAFDTSWLKRATGLEVSHDREQLDSAPLVDLAARQWSDEDTRAVFSVLSAALPARGALLDRDPTSLHTLYTGSPDPHGEYPVVSVDIDETPPLVTIDHAGFDLWLAAMAGYPCRERARAAELTACRRRVFAGGMYLALPGPWGGLAPFDHSEQFAAVSTSAPEDRAADRLVAAIERGDRPRISTALADNARHWPRGPWRERAVIAALYRFTDEILAEVLAAGGDPRAGSSEGRVLTLAAALGAAGKVRMLLTAGADPRGADDSGELALNRAAAEGYREVVGVLLDAGASWRTEDHKGRAPLLEAASHNHHQVVALLLERGADPDQSQEGSCAPLHCAVEHGRLDTVQLLLERGASPDPRNWCGDTPLHVAVKRDHADIARLLLDRGARRDLANHDGWTVDSLIDARGQARREVSVTYRASAESQDLVIEVELLSWDRTRFAPELPLRMSATLAPLVAMAAAGGLGADRFDPSQARAEVVAVPQSTLVPMIARHTLRWQLRIAGLAPAGIAVMLAPLLWPIGETRVTRLTVTGTLALDNTGDTVVIAGPDAQARIAALADELRCNRGSRKVPPGPERDRDALPG